ncbi:MAG: shikimate kinase [Phycisphaerales bacterium JB040]
MAETPTPKLILLGLRGSGKSTLGRRLGERLGRVFVDLDDITAMALDAPGPAPAIERLGLLVFRAAEAEALAGVLRRPDAGVVALGGGTPTAPGAGEALRHARTEGVARLCYLRASAETLAARLRKTDLGERPSLTGSGTLEEIGTLLEQRDGPYRALADTVIETDTLSEDQTLQTLAAWAEQTQRA